MLERADHDRANGGAQFFDALGDVQSDSLLALIAHGQCRSSGPTRSTSASASIATAIGNTPILRAVKAAEKLLWETQESKSYLGGVRRQALSPSCCGRSCSGEHADDDRIAGLQTPGGCGALSLGFKLIATRQSRGAGAGRHADLAQPSCRSFEAAGLEHRRISLLRPRSSRSIRFDAMMAAFEGGAARATSSCSTAAATIRPAPTSTPANGPRWSTRVVERGLMPFVDIAYQGLGRGLDEDAAGLHVLLDACDEVRHRAKLRQEFRRLSRPRRLAVHQDRAARGDRQRAMGHVAPDRARDVVDAARSWRGGGAHRAGDAGADAPTGDAEARRDARRGSTAIRDAHRRRRPAPGLYRRAVSACSRCCR